MPRKRNTQLPDLSVQLEELKSILPTIKNNQLKVRLLEVQKDIEQSIINEVIEQNKPRKGG